MKTTLLLISFICFAISAIVSARKSYRWYKKYVIDLFEYNKGRGYFETWKNSKEKFCDYLFWTIVFILLDVIIFTYNFQ